jgi:hypothetical protein
MLQKSVWREQPLLGSLSLHLPSRGRYAEVMARDNMGKRLRREHLRSLSPAEKIELNYREAAQLREINPDYAWRRFRDQWRRRASADAGR